jgi:hypothetical protein
MKIKYILLFIAIMLIIYGSISASEKVHWDHNEKKPLKSSQTSGHHTSFLEMDFTSTKSHEKLSIKKEDENLPWISQYIMETLFDSYLEKTEILDGDFYNHKENYHKELADFDYPKNHPIFALLNYKVKKPIRIEYKDHSHGNLIFTFVPKPKHHKKKQTTISFRGIRIPEYLEGEIEVDSACGNIILGSLRMDGSACFIPVKYRFDPIYKLGKSIYEISVTMSIMRDNKIGYVAEKTTTLYLQVK